MSKPTETIVLCEDKLTESLLRSYLKSHNINARNIRFVTSPKGRGSGERFVIRQFPTQVDAYRISKAKKTTWPIVVIDADTGTVATHITELDSSLRTCGNERLRSLRLENENIARLIPRRDIETWLLILDGTDANEEIDYSKSKSRDEWHSLAMPGGAQLHDWTRNNAQVPPTCIESLRHGIRELRRIEVL
jgi:hypothetical protein